MILKTGAKCAAVNNCSLDGNGKPKCNDLNKITDRYIYVNNVPQGNIPFISSALGTNFSEFKGIIPGAMGNLNTLNPYGIMQSFLSGSTPQCQEITMEKIDVNNNRSTETEYVTVVDIKNMDPCNFRNGQNPITRRGCQQAFTNRLNEKNDDSNNNLSLPSDPLAQIYFASLSAVGIYIIYRLMDKTK